MLAGRCRYHPERDAVAMCMRCTAAVCAGCTTKLDGVNHCRACLEGLRAVAVEPPRAESSAVLRALLVLSVHGGLLLAILLLTMFWRSRS